MTKIDVEDLSDERQIALQLAKRKEHERAMALAMEALGENCVGVLLIGVTNDGQQSRASMGIGFKTTLTAAGLAKTECVLTTAAEIWLASMKDGQS
jgi:hypothetical protein